MKNRPKVEKRDVYIYRRQKQKPPSPPGLVLVLRNLKQCKVTIAISQ